MAVDPTCDPTCGQAKSYFMAMQRYRIIIQFSGLQHNRVHSSCVGLKGLELLVPLQVGPSGYDVQSVMAYIVPMNCNLKKGQLTTHPIWPFKSN